MSIVSYAQNYEDVILHRALKDIEFGFYIDVGAQDPVEYSVTKAFYELGWRGVNVEPIAHWFEKLVADRPHDINLQLAAAEKPGNLHLYEILNTGLSTSSAEFARRHIERGFSVHEVDVACITLDEICEQNAVETVHFLKIDCEGSEASVLRGFSFDRWRPWIVLVEATEPLSKEPTHLAWESLIVDRGYHVIYKDGLNRFYVADEHAELDEAFSYPPNVFDEFVRAAELSVRNDLEAARRDLCSLHEARNIGRLEGQLEFLTGENERREAALVEHRRMLDEAGLREALTAERIQAERDQLRSEIEYLRGENERRESALSDSRRLIEEVTQRESENAVRLLDQSQLRDEVEFLRGENERREAALVEIRRSLEEACQREVASAAQLRDEQDLSKKEIEYLRSENERREAALVAIRVLLDEATQREAVYALEVKGQHDLLRQEIEYLRSENERREGALAEQRNIFVETVKRHTEYLAEQIQILAATDEKSSWLSEKALLQGEVGRLHHEVVFRDNEIVGLRKTIHDFQVSMSWRATYPLRFCKRNGVAVAKKARGVGYALARGLAHVLRQPMRFIARSHAVRALAVRVIGIDSSLTKHARLFLFGNGPVVSEKVSLNTTETRVVLTRRATQIFSELRRAQRKKLLDDGSLGSGRA